MKVYQHGGDVTAFAKELGCHINEVIDLSSNINFVKPKVDIDFNTLDISAYPNYNTLYETIAKHYGIETKNMELYNGGSAAIFTLFRELKLEHCTIYSPAYLEYKKAATLFGYNITHINRLENINQEVKENSLVVFVNPSTPDGKFYDIENLMQQWIHKNCTILIDESFLDFTPYSSTIPYLSHYEKFYILKSMTKFYSSAGIRVGTLLSNASNISKLRSKEPLWKLSQFDSTYLQAVLQDETFKERAKKLNDTNRDFLMQILKNSKYIKSCFVSSANFVLIQLDNISAINFKALLKPHKIMVRDCSNFDYLDDSFVRIAVKSKEHLNVLQKALDA